MTQRMAAQQTHPHELNLPAFILSLLAGLWMLAAGGMLGGFGMGSTMGGGMYGGYGHDHRMYGWRGMHGWMYGSGVHASGANWPWIGVLAGLVVLAGAAFLFLKPSQQRAWGTAIIVISALDFLFGMGGLAAGTLGIVAGVLALAE